MLETLQTNRFRMRIFIFCLVLQTNLMLEKAFVHGSNRKKIADPENNMYIEIYSNGQVGN